MLLMECHFIIILKTCLNMHKIKHHVSKLTQTVQFLFILGVTDLLWPVLCHRPSWSFIMVVYIFSLRQVAHVTYVFAHVARACLYYVTNITCLYSARLDLGKEVVMMGNIRFKF